MEKNRNIPALRFPEFGGEWERKRLGDVFSIFNGYAFSSSDSIKEGALWVKIADVGIKCTPPARPISPLIIGVNLR